MKRASWTATLALAILGGSAVQGAEPNETVATATVLGSGILSVTDALTPGSIGQPDTILGTRDFFGAIQFTNDNDSPLGDGRASGLGGVPTISGEIKFAVTGFGDEGFFGDHEQQGAYEVYVDVFQGDELVDQWREIRHMELGVVDEWSYSNFDWFGATYDVSIDNVIAAGGDVDFYQFTGLTPGTTFTAQTSNVASADLDTVLAMFDPLGTPLGVNDDISPSNPLSRLEGTVPVWGSLIFAVTGYGDADNYLGYHTQNGSYKLQLTLSGGGSPADFNNDNLVNAADLALWKGGFGPTAAGDADGDADTDGADFLLWQREFGGASLLAAVTSVPEPSITHLVAVAFAFLSLRRRLSP